MTDDLLYHGDLNAALRRMLQSGFRDPTGSASRAWGHPRSCAAGARTRWSSHDLGGVYDDIAQELRYIVDTEREALDQLVQRSPARAATSGAKR